MGGRHAQPAAPVEPVGARAHAVAGPALPAVELSHQDQPPAHGGGEMGRQLTDLVLEMLERQLLNGRLRASLLQRLVHGCLLCDVDVVPPVYRTHVPSECGARGATGASFGSPDEDVNRAAARRPWPSVGVAPHGGVVGIPLSRMLSAPGEPIMYSISERENFSKCRSVSTIFSRSDRDSIPTTRSLFSDFRNLQHPGPGELLQPSGRLSAGSSVPSRYGGPVRIAGDQLLAMPRTETCRLVPARAEMSLTSAVRTTPPPAAAQTATTAASTWCCEPRWTAARRWPIRRARLRSVGTMEIPPSLAKHESTA